MYKISVEVPMHQNYLQIEAPTGYLNQWTFSSFWTISLANGALTPVSGGPAETTDPVIIGSPDGSYAMGAFMESCNGEQYVHYARFDFPNSVSAAATSKWSVVYRNEQGIPAGFVINVATVLCIGTLSAVQTCMVNVAKQTGYVNCAGRCLKN